MDASSIKCEELLLPRKTHTRNHKTKHRGLVINIGTDTSLVLNETNSKKIPPSGSTLVPARQVPVLYYISRNGHLEHPHLIDVNFSSPNGLYLKDFINTLNDHRGNGMANAYSWSFKRSYKSGYVWQDASENDLIQPTNSHDYVLKGSELLQTQPHSSENYIPRDKCTSTKEAPKAETILVGRNQSWSSFDNPHDYLVVKCESNRELAAKFFSDASAQTGDELSTQEMTPSPPPSNSSSEGLETVNGSREADQKVEDQHGNNGRMKASQVLLQLISCGADPLRNDSPLR